MAIAMLGGPLVQPAAAQGGAAALDLVRVAVGLREQGLRDRSISTCEEFLRRYPTHAEAARVRYTRAQCLFELQRYPRAARAFDEITRLHPHFGYLAESRFRGAECLYRAGDFAKAFLAFSRFLSFHPDHYLVETATFLAGESAFRSGRFAEAEQAYRRYLATWKRGEHRSEAARGLVWSLFRQSRWKDAEREIGAALKAAGDATARGELFFLRGECAFQREDWSAAVEAYRKVPAEHEYGDDALSARSYALARGGEKEQAARDFESLCARWPRSPLARDARLRAGLLRVELGQGSRAVKLLEPLLAEKNAAAQEAALALGELALAAKHPGEGQSYFERALEGPEPRLRNSARLGLADCLMALGKSAAAAKLYDQAAAAGEEADYALAALITAEFNAQHYERVVAAARRFKTRFSDSRHLGEVSHALAEALFALERYDEAAREYRFLAKKVPARRALASYRIAWCDYRGGALERACKAFATFLSEHPGDPHFGEACAVLGRIRLDRGEAALAEQAYRRALGAQAGEYADDCSLGLARALAARTKTGAAIAQLEKFTRSFPDSPLLAQALFERGELLYAQEEWKLALGCYRDLRQRCPGDDLLPYALHGEGWCQVELGDFKSARAAARKVQASGVKALLEPALELEAAALRGEGQKAEAAALYRRLAESTEDAARGAAARLDAAVLLREAGDAAGARRELKVLLERYPGMKELDRVLFELALAHLDCDEQDAARAALERLLKECPHSARIAAARFQLGEIDYGRGALESALRWYDSVLATPGAADLAPAAAYKGGWALLKLKRNAEAGQHFERVEREDPQGRFAGEALFLAGECSYRQRQFERARACFERVRKAFPGHEVSSRNLFRLGLCEGELGRWTACYENLRELLDEHPQFKLAAEARLWVGRSLRHLGQHRRSLEYLEKAEGTARGSIQAQMKIEMGRALLDLKRPDDAAGKFLQVKYVFNLPREVAEATFLAAEAFRLQGEDASATKFYRELLEKYPDDPHAAEARRRLRDL